MTDLLTTIRFKLQYHDLNHIAALMGYQNSDKAFKRLKFLLFAPDLLQWFDHSGYDFKYSNREFILKLGKILGIPQTELIDGIKAVNDEQVRIAQMFQPYIFVDTKFKRKSEPIFVLGCMESRRRLSISKYAVLRDQAAELRRICQIVQQHYRESNGKLELWGKIHQYLYVFGENQHVVIQPDGKIISDAECQPQRASLTLKGKDICPVLGID